MKKLKGGITVFAALSILLVASFIFSLLEAARMEGLRSYVKQDRMTACENVFSKYNRIIFEHYGLMVLDAAFGGRVPLISEMETEFQAESQKNLSPYYDSTYMLKGRQNFFLMDTKAATLKEYRFVTDNDGKVFEKLVTESLKYEIGIDAAKKLLEKLEEGEKARETAVDQNETAAATVDNVKEEQARVERERVAAAGGDPSGIEKADELSSVENPVDTMENVKKKDLLTLCLPVEKRVSTKKISEKETLLNRSLSQGNMSEVETSWYEEVLFQEFLYQKFDCFSDSKNEKDKALDYELEYILAGKEEDRDNLKHVVTELVLIREGMNFVYLISDQGKCDVAKALATVILIPFQLEAYADVLAVAILAAWAYLESILDLRTLLSGGKINWLKTKEDWTTSIEGLADMVGNASVKAKNCAGGDNYRDYLQKLLFLESRKKLAYRTMDLLEQRVRLSKDHKDFSLDACLVTGVVEFEYEATPLFSVIVPTVKKARKKYTFTTTQKFSYFDDDG